MKKIYLVGIICLFLIILIIIETLFTKEKKQLTFLSTQKPHNHLLNLSKKANVQFIKENNLLQPWNDSDTECELYYLTLIKPGRSESIQSIRRDANMNTNIHLKLILNNEKIDKKVLKSIVKYYYDVVKPSVYWLKFHYNRVRPFFLEKEVGNKFGIKIPDHPSYPSAHATDSYFFGYCLSKITKNNKFLKEADNIAYRRELIGMHYPSDSEYGHFLGKFFADDWFKKNKVNST